MTFALSLLNTIRTAKYSLRGLSFLVVLAFTLSLAVLHFANISADNSMTPVLRREPRDVSRATDGRRLLGFAIAAAVLSYSALKVFVGQATQRTPRTSTGISGLLTVLRRSKYSLKGLSFIVLLAVTLSADVLHVSAPSHASGDGLMLRLLRHEPRSSESQHGFTAAPQASQRFTQSAGMMRREGPGVGVSTDFTLERNLALSAAGLALVAWKVYVGQPTAEMPVRKLHDSSGVLTILRRSKYSLRGLSFLTLLAVTLSAGMLYATAPITATGEASLLRRELDAVRAAPSDGASVGMRPPEVGTMLIIVFGAAALAAFIRQVWLSITTVMRAADSKAAKIPDVKSF